MTDGSIPICVAIGNPDCGESTALKCGMSLLGHTGRLDNGNNFLKDFFIDFTWKENNTSVSIWKSTDQGFRSSKGATGVKFYTNSNGDCIMHSIYAL